MNYLLVMPKRLSTGASTTSIIFPLGIAYVSSALKKAGYNVFTANLDFTEGDTSIILKEIIEKHSIDVVCTGGLSLDCHKIKEVIDSARLIKPNILTVVGGGIISSDPITAMNVLKANIGVIGEGEVTICELAKNLESGKRFNGIPGLIYWDNNELVTTEHRKEILDLDEIPFPDFEGFNYASWVKHSNGVGVLLSDRSCPFKCTFCFHPTGVKYRQRSLDNIFDEIDYQIQNFKVKSIGLTSELFATSKKRISDFCARISTYGISWSCCLRVTDVDFDILKQMKNAGCTLICYGLESGDDTVLKSMQKGIQVKQIKHALDLSYEVGIATDDSNFIFGDLNETLETFNNTLELWFQYNSKTHINLSLIQTYPGTYLYEYACNQGIITNKEQFLLDGCPIINVSKLSHDEFQYITSKIAELRMYPHVPAKHVIVDKISSSNSCSVEYTCRKCGTNNFINTSFWFTSTCYCYSCGIKNEVDTFRCASCDEESFFAGLNDVQLIALWGAGGIFYKIRQAYPSFASDKFILVDSNTEHHGLVLFNKTVNPPDTIANKKIQVVIITALSRKDEVIETILKSYPSVIDIFVPSFEIRGSLMVPILQKIERNS